MSGKKPLILYVLKILETETDERHPMTQTELTSVIAKDARRMLSQRQKIRQG